MKNSKKDISLNTDNFILKTLSSKDSRCVISYIIDNKEFHKNAMPDRNSKFYTEKFQKIILEEEEFLALKVKSIRFYISKPESDKILGDVLISDIKTGNVSSGTIGIKIHKDYTNLGIAYECLDKLIQFAFDGLKIYRLEANIMPSNLASISLFTKFGFTKEGIARAYFKTGGIWQDHLRFSLLKDDK